MPWIVIPNVFRGDGGQRVPVSQLDNDFQYLADKLNAFNPTGAAAGPGGLYSVRNLVGENDGGAPNTKMDFTADEILLRNPIDGSFIVRVGVPLTNDISVSGPAVNGRDQGGSFTVSSWIHMYAIFNPTSATMGTISSATAPTTGPALPSGYTMWEYLGAYRLDGSGNLVPVHQRGSQIFYSVAQQVVTAASPTVNTETGVNLAAIVPPNALTELVTVGARYGNVGATATNLQFRVVSGQNQSTFRGYVVAGGLAAITAQVELPAFAQQYLYLWTVDTPSTPTFVNDQYVTGYRIPNGGE